MSSRFHIPLDNQRPLFGVFLACHAIPDSLDIMHTAVGCKPKAQRQISSHDRMREAQNKMVWSDVDESLLITGSAERLHDMTVETVARREQVGVVFITTSTAMEMTSLDVPSVVERIRAHVRCPVVYVPTPGFAGDLHEGYQRVVRAVVELCDWSAGPRERDGVNLVGYLFDRYEHDHAMSLHEVRRLLAGLGLKVVSTLLSGTPMAGLLMAPRAELNIVLPWAASIRSSVEGTSGRPCIDVDLPLGVANTTRFIREVAARRHVAPNRVEHLVESETARIEPLLRVARERLSGSRMAVLADTPTAAGLAGLAADLGMRTVLVGLLDRTLGGREALEHALVRSDRELDCTVLESPTAQQTATALHELGADAPHVIVSPDVWLPPHLTADAGRVQLGIPSNLKHAIYAQPVLGYRGAVSLSQRLMDARAGVF